MVVPWFLDACYAVVAEKKGKQVRQFASRSESRAWLWSLLLMTAVGEDPPRRDGDGKPANKGHARAETPIARLAPFLPHARYYSELRGCNHHVR